MGRHQKSCPQKSQPPWGTRSPTKHINKIHGSIRRHAEPQHFIICLSNLILFEGDQVDKEVDLFDQTSRWVLREQTDMPSLFKSHHSLRKGCLCQLAARSISHQCEDTRELSSFLQNQPQGITASRDDQAAGASIQDKIPWNGLLTYVTQCRETNRWERVHCHSYSYMEMYLIGWLERRGSGNAASERF